MLTVVTHTRFNRPDLLTRCQASVEAALPQGAVHEIIECQSDWAQARYDGTQLSEFVAFVDDDDTIDSRSLKLCLEAIQKTGAGLAFTDELSVDLSGKELQEHRGQRWYGAIGIHPRTVHHLCVLRRSSVDVKALALHEKFGMGADWFLKASAALTGGAIHVPIDGYFWTQHDGTMTKADNAVFNTRVREMGRAIRSTWPRADGRIPQM